MTKLTLVSHHLCPYVQRIAISLVEKGVPFDRVDVDLSDKPDWFIRISPFGKVPLLRVEESGGETILFESIVILEYLEETHGPSLNPGDPLERAQRRSWIEFGSGVLNKIGALYNAGDAATFEERRRDLAAMLDRVEAELSHAPWFAGENFSLVDAVFGPVFRYFDVFESEAGVRLGGERPKVDSWRRALADRPSIKAAVAPDYPARLAEFLRNRNSAISRML